MQLADSLEFDGPARALARARAYLEPPARKRSIWPVLGAAAAFAASAMLFAVAAIMAPPMTLTHIPASETSAEAVSAAPVGDPGLAGAVK